MAGRLPEDRQGGDGEGALLYKTHCLQCHALIDREDPGRKVTAVMNGCGTDPRVATNFIGRTGPSGKLHGVKANFLPFTTKIPPVADADRMLSNVVIGVIRGRSTQAPPDELSQVRFRAAPSVSVREAAQAAQLQGAPAQRRLGYGALPSQRLGAEPGRPAPAGRAVPDIVQHRGPHL